MSTSQNIFVKTFRRLDLFPTTFLTMTPVAALVLSLIYIFSGNFHYGALILFAIFYTLTAMSITCGYHRLFAHKSYDASLIVRLFYALFGAAAFQNSILVWATDHRIHHRFVDSDQDPYTIKKGFWFAHIGWMLLKADPHPHKNAYNRDLMKDKIVLWQHKYYIPISVFMGLILPGLLGLAFFNSFLGGLAFGGFLRLVAVHHGTFLINSLSHWWGAQTYTDKNTARDNLFAAFLTFGEGYHNFHHLFANDYRNGIRWYHWDPTKWAIQIKSKLGLVSNLKKTSEDKILKAKLEMDEKRLARKLSIDHFSRIQSTVDELRQRLLNAQSHVQKLREEYLALKSQKSADYKQRLISAKKEWQKAKIEWSYTYREWKWMLSQFISTAS